MVMLANKKTVHQINNDLQLFLGDNTNLFTTWLQEAIANANTLLAGDNQRGKNALQYLYMYTFEFLTVQYTSNSLLLLLDAWPWESGMVD